jgi:hypothetical protein
MLEMVYVGVDVGTNPKYKILNELDSVAAFRVGANERSSQTVMEMKNHAGLSHGS